MDSVVRESGFLDQKAVSSETGPGVDIYAPGTNIRSACSNTNAFSAQNYYLNASFRQVTISGTSMASPQVAGVCALILQLNPGVSPIQLKNNLISVAGSSMYESGLDNDWSDRRSLYGGEPTVLYNRFNQDVSTIVSGEFVKFANIGV
jgi:subtilisin family serine protease